MTTLTSRTLLLCALAAAARLAGAQGCKPLQWKGAGEERLLADRRQRVRDVREKPDGALCVRDRHFVYRVGRRLSPTARAFMDFARAEAKGLFRDCLRG